MSALTDKQATFAYSLGRLLTDGLLELRRTYPSARFRLGEGYVGDSVGPNDKSPHLRHGGHFKRLAQDLVLDIEGLPVTDGEHPAWRQLANLWREYGPYHTTGIDFNDANHFSITDGGVR